MSSFILKLGLFTFVLVFLLGLYGISTGSFAISNTIAQITENWPTVSTSNCSFSAAGPSGSCNIVDTVELGGIWFLTTVGSVLYRIGAVFYLMYQIFSFLNSYQSFPFLGWMFGFLIFGLGIETFLMLRSGRGLNA